MVPRVYANNAFEFVIVSALRTAQLMRGCEPRLIKSEKPAVTAQREVAGGLVKGIRDKNAKGSAAINR